MSRTVARAYTISDLRQLAYKRLPKPIYDFLDGGAGAEAALRGNVAALDAVRLVPRVAQGFSAVDTTARLLEYSVAAPIVLAPAGGAGAYHPTAEVAVAEAAREAGLPYALSMGSTRPLEQVGPILNGDLSFFQLYPFADDQLNRDILARARLAGFTALMVTVDCPIPGRKPRDWRHGLAPGQRFSAGALVSFAMHPRWLHGVLTSRGMELGNLLAVLPPGQRSLGAARGYLGRTLARGLDWPAVERLVRMWGGPLLIKGVLHPDDAYQALERGAAGVVVSNHGGRQLESACASISVLPAIRAAVGGEATVLVDGGIRTGSDIIRALALGADAAMIGRPYLYGLAAGGRGGVSQAIKILNDELRTDMHLIGATSIDAIGPQFTAIQSNKNTFKEEDPHCAEATAA